MFHSTKQRILSFVVFGIYLILLIWIVLFKFPTNLSALPSMRSINWIPFYYEQETNVHRSEILYNILVFVPLGFYIQIFRQDWKIPIKCLLILGTSFLFEAVQFIFAIGASDITDLIGNTFGGFSGILFCMILRKTAPEKFLSVINIFGLLIEIGIVGSMVLLLIANL